MKKEKWDIIFVQWKVKFFSFNSLNIGLHTIYTVHTFQLFFQNFSISIAFVQVIMCSKYLTALVSIYVVAISHQ